MKGYSLFLTLWKAGWAWAVAMGVGGAADVAAVGFPASPEELKTKWPVLALALAVAFWKVAENTRKNWNGPEGEPLWKWPWTYATPAAVKCLLIGGLAVLLGAGCSTVGTKFQETVTEYDDGSTATETLYKARSVAGPAGKLDATAHEWTYKYGGDENVISTGQDSAGVDNTSQVAIFASMMEIVKMLVQMQLVPPPAPAAAGASGAGIFVPGPGGLVELSP